MTDTAPNTSDTNRPSHTNEDARAAQARAAIRELGEQFPRYPWMYESVPGTGGKELRFDWYGRDDEDIMVLAHVGRQLHERFHRHGFFFFNYAYRGDYQALSHSRYNLITVHEGEMYVGQPFSGYALRGNADQDIVIMGVLVRTETFYHEFLPFLMDDTDMLDFFLGPKNNLFSEEYRWVDMTDDVQVRPLLEMMAIEYTHQSADTQRVLKPLALTLTMLVARQWRRNNPRKQLQDSLAQKVVSAISKNLGHASLSELADQLGYHPNYLSTRIRKDTGKSFSQLVTEQRMERAGVLVERTTLPVEEIARTVGYSSTSNFYKAYNRYFGHSPRRNSTQLRKANGSKSK